MKIMPLGISLFIFSCIWYQMIHAMDRPLVVACNMYAMSEDGNLGAIIKNVTENAFEIIKDLKKPEFMKLSGNIPHITSRGYDFAKELSTTTPGNCNVAIKVCQLVYQEKFLKKAFTPEQIQHVCRLVIAPVLVRHAIDHLKQMKELGISLILTCPNDGMVYEMFKQKMLENKACKVDLKDYFEGVVTTPTLNFNAEGYRDFDFSDPAAVCKVYQPRWFVARNPPPSPTFNRTIRILSQEIKPDARTIVIDMPEQLAAITHALQQTNQQHVITPELAGILTHTIE